MKQIITFSYSVFFVAFVLLLFSCSKDDLALKKDQEKLKSEKIGDKVFPGQAGEKWFSSGGFGSLFSDGTGNYNFTSYDPSLPGGGVTPPPLPGGPGVLNFKGQSIPLVFAGSFNDGEGFFEVFFIDQVPSVAGFTGFSGIMFDIISPSPNFIQSGSYSYSGSGEPFTFEFAEIGLKVDTNDEEYYTVTSGTINFSGSGNSFDITFQGQTAGNHQFSGSFSGNLMQFN